MPSILHQLAQRGATAADASNASYLVYASAVLLATFSFVFMLLILPPMIWHFHNRNIGATSLVAWTALLLAFNFINAIIWSNDDIDHWYNGVGLCDFEVKVQIASETGRAASLACILRALAAVLDTSRASLIKTKAQRWRGYAIDLTCCLGFPLLQMVFHYVVQNQRYYIYGISGCFPATGMTLETVFLIGIPPLIWTVINLYYAVMILIRLYQYRSTFSSILANNNTTQSRFMRLYIVCIVWICGYIPVECYIFYFNFSDTQLEPYSWSAAHDPEKWKQIIMIPSGGNIVFDRWIWLSCGLVVFVFFGMGKDAVNMYRKNLLVIGLGKVFPRLQQEYRGSITGAIGSYGSKARMMFSRKSTLSNSTWKSGSAHCHTSASSDPSFPYKEKDVDIVGRPSRSPGENTRTNNQNALDGTKAAEPTLSRLSRMLSTTKRKTSAKAGHGDQVPLNNLSGELLTVQSAVTSGPRSPTLTEHTRSISSEEVLMRREVRQGSEYELLRTLNKGEKC